MLRIWEKLSPKGGIYFFNFAIGLLAGWIGVRSWGLHQNWLEEKYYVAYMVGLIPFLIILIEKVIVKLSIGWRASLVLTASMYVSFPVFWVSDGGYLPLVWAAWLAALTGCGAIIPKLIDVLGTLLRHTMAR